MTQAYRLRSRRAKQDGLYACECGKIATIRYGSSQPTSCEDCYKALEAFFHTNAKEVPLNRKRRNPEPPAEEEPEPYEPDWITYRKARLKRAGML